MPNYDNGYTDSDPGPDQDQLRDQDTGDEANKKSAGAAEDEILIEARKRFVRCEEAEHRLRELAMDDLRFRAGEQWPEKLKAQRNLDARPCLTINILPARERQILNDQRQNRPSIKISAVDDGADEDTAEIIQGLIRHIEYDSNAEVAYDTAFAAAVRSGFGYFRVITEEEGDRQVIKIKRVRNAFMVYMDPNCQEPDYSDAKFGFVFTTFTKNEFKDEYPDSELSLMDDWTSIGDHAPGWVEKDGVRVAEYFYFEKGKITWCKINGIEILERTEWPGRWIPIIPVLGDEIDLDGERQLEGMVRHTKDAVRMQNYMASAEVEAIALAPKAPFVVAGGQIEGYEKFWRQLNTRNLAYLPYKPVAQNGAAVPPPQRQLAEPAIQAITQARAQFSQDLQDITGIYYAQLGQRSNETSGVAINNRRVGGELTNFHYQDNLARSIKHLGNILLDLIPHVYDDKRIVRIVNPDGTDKRVQINAPFQNKGKKTIYDLRKGRYGVVVSTGPGFQTKRQEAAAGMIEMTKAWPPMMQLAGDLLVKNLDWPGHEELAERLRKAMPPQLLDDNTDDPKVVAQKLQSENMMLMQHNQANMQIMQKLQQELQAKVVDNQFKADIAKHKEEVQMILQLAKMENDRAIAEIESKAQDAQQRRKLDADLDIKQHVSAHEVAMQAMQQNHERQMGTQQAMNDSASQASDQSHEATMAAGQQDHESKMADKAAIQAQQSQTLEGQSGQ